MSRQLGDEGKQERFSSMIKHEISDFLQTFHMFLFQRCDTLLFMSDASDPVLGSVKLDVEGGYNSLWGKTKEVKTFDDDYYAALQMVILMIILMMMIANEFI